MKKNFRWSSFFVIVLLLSLITINFIACENIIPSPCGCDPCRGAEDYYIGNKNTKVFHRPCCGHLPDKSNQVIFDTRKEAVDAGYRPCYFCEP